MSKRYQEYINKMLEENKAVFDEFKKIHDEYKDKGDIIQEQFNTVGEKILRLIQDYEDRLCANQERGMYNKFSGGLSEKFRSEIKNKFPFIDYIGLKVERF